MSLVLTPEQKALAVGRAEAGRVYKAKIINLSDELATVQAENARLQAENLQLQRVAQAARLYVDTAPAEAAEVYQELEKQLAAMEGR